MTALHFVMGKLLRALMIIGCFKTGRPNKKEKIGNNPLGCRAIYIQVIKVLTKEAEKNVTTLKPEYVLFIPADCSAIIVIEHALYIALSIIGDAYSQRALGFFVCAGGKYVHLVIKW